MESSQSSSPSAAPWATEQTEQTPSNAPAQDENDTFAERPEVFVGAAFAGGLALAVTLRWLGSR